VILPLFRGNERSQDAACLDSVTDRERYSPSSGLPGQQPVALELDGPLDATAPQRIEDAHAPAPDLGPSAGRGLRRPQARIRYRAPLPKSVRYSSPVSPSPNELMVRLVSSIWCGN